LPLRRRIFVLHSRIWLVVRARALYVLQEMNLPIASVSCRCSLPSGASKDVVIGVTSPQPHTRCEYSCFVSLPDRDEPFEIYGVDSLQCLSLGMRFASSRIDDLISKGWTFFGRDGDEEYEMEWSAYFMPQTVLDKLSAIGEKAMRSIDSKTKESEAEQAAP
jgi:hypothetical protein